MLTDDNDDDSDNNNVHDKGHKCNQTSDDVSNDNYNFLDYYTKYDCYDYSWHNQSNHDDGIVDIPVRNNNLGSVFNNTITTP